METIPIAQLAPTIPTPDAKAVAAIVTLIWPYSSSTKTCAVLLAEYDFRLRRRKGQVRVQFTGPSATAVAESGIGIGDEVTLGLAGAKWLADAGDIKTPGRSVDWELLYDYKLVLEVRIGPFGAEKHFAEYVRLIGHSRRAAACTAKYRRGGTDSSV